MVFGSIVATGAGLHAAADFIEHRSGLDSVATVVAVAVPVGGYIGAVFGDLPAADPSLGRVLMPLSCWSTLAVLGTAVGLASAGVSTPVCLLVVTAAPAAVVCQLRVARASADIGRAQPEVAERPATDLDAALKYVPSKLRRVAAISTTSASRNSASGAEATRG